MYRRKGPTESMHVDFVEILRKYIRQWGEDEGPGKFYDWIEALDLDLSKPYTVPAQLMRECLNGMCEAFRWVAPYIQFYKEDSDAKYYKSTALTANVSMNKNDYEDAIELAANAASLGWKPLNLNHDHSKWLPFPENRTDLTRFEDNSVETIIRISNEGRVPGTSYSMRDIQRMIENGEIYHVSIEGEPRAGEVTERGKAPQGYIFTSLALLEKDKTLPGDPLTRLEPLFLRESMGRSLVESLSKGEIIRIEVKPKMAITEDWTTAYINDLPNSAFAVVEPCADERKDARHLPYKDASGEVDLPHLRNALARMNQIKSVCGGSDEELRAKAKRKLIPLAKKHLPNSQWAKEEFEEGVGGISQCGQCRYFDETLTTEVRRPDVTGQPSDTYVIHTELGMATGTCQLTGKSVRKNDAVCSDGRPRDEATSLARTIEVLELKREIADLEGKGFAKDQYITKIVEREAKALKENVELADKLTYSERERAELEAKNSRLKKENDELREKCEKLEEGLARTKIDITDLSRDVKHYKDQYDAHVRTVERQDVKIQEMKEELAKVYEKLNEEAEKRATAMQRAQNAESDKARIVTENAINLQKLSGTMREVSDLSTRLREYAKQQVVDGSDIALLRKERERLIEEIRDVKQKLSQSARKIKVKI